MRVRLTSQAASDLAKALDWYDANAPVVSILSSGPVICKPPDFGDRATRISGPTRAGAV
jgi:hypothetical protein